MYIELSWDNRKYYLSKLPHRSQVMFALFCARQVVHLARNVKECREAIETVERWLEGKGTVEECKKATTAAIVATYDAAACAAVGAAIVATYAEAAYADAADAAADAADAVDDADDTKQKQVEYLKYLYLMSLPEDQKNNWLMQACL
jgi:hypothetical protein